ncbi:hypothetical protein [Leptospira noguchii]|nr:hypothetical protein [Leptospira noguchii]UOG30241.1 hypothetical protein MAL06_16910 [Leptospira noguchii]
MGSLYKEQKKTNELLQKQAKIQTESLQFQNEEIRKQTALLEQEQRNREYQKNLKTYLFELKNYSDSILSKKYSPASAYIVADTLKSRLSTENISVHSFEELQDKEYFSQVYEVFNNIIKTSNANTVEEANQYKAKCNEYLKEIHNRIFLKDYFSNNLVSFFYRLIPLGELFLKKFQWESIIILWFSVYVVPLIYYLNQKKKNYTTILTSVGLGSY